MILDAERGVGILRITILTQLRKQGSLWDHTIIASYSSDKSTMCDLRIHLPISYSNEGCNVDREG